MARLPRLSVPNQLHLIVQRAAAERPVLVEPRDLDAYQALLRDAGARHGVALHAFALTRTRIWLLATPTTEAGLGAALQAVGRGFVAGFNRRHGRSGPLWDGRFRCAVIEAEPYFVDCLRFVDTAPVRQGLVELAEDWAWSSVAHHVGSRRVAGVSDHQLWLTLGNTPFEREAAYRSLLNVPLDPALTQQLERAASSGWALGANDFVGQIAAQVKRRVTPLRRGRTSMAVKRPR
jgi:putative transposase